ncbi:MAG: hypothetical protein ACOYKE_15145 [Ferruginibacter sp.]
MESVFPHVNGIAEPTALLVPSAISIDKTAVANDNYGPGSYGFFDPSTWLSVDTSFFSEGTCCPLILASGSVLSKDKLNQYIGGYKESTKSKLINPKYIQKVYRVDSCVPQQAVTSIGTTPQTSLSSIATLDNGSLVAGTNYTTNGTYFSANLDGGSGTGAKGTVVVAGNVVTSITITTSGQGYVIGDTLTVNTTDVPNTGVDSTIDVLTLSTVSSNLFLGGTTQANCAHDFYCGETYYLRIDLKGSPVLRFLNHNAYQTLSAYTGCCAGITPETVDPTLVYLTWAKALLLNAYLKDLVAPVVYDYTGVAWYAPGTTVTMDGTSTPVLPTQWWTSAAGVDQYAASAQAIAWTTAIGGSAGMRLFGAYVGTQFGNCTFQVTDFFEKAPVLIYASLVDYNGDPCVFEGVCVYNDCRGIQGMGFGEQVVRDLILSESYLQNFFANNDLRIREITQGYDILNAVDRNALYTRYFLLHSVPRWNNPTSVFDTDRYMVEIISAGQNATLEEFLGAWLDACPGCIALEEETCTSCTIIAD